MKAWVVSHRSRAGTAWVFRTMVRIAVIAAVLAAPASWVASPAVAATIAGRVFTADDPDSIAPGAPVSVVFRPPAGEVQRLQTTADAEGHFHFVDLSADSSIAYVLRIDFKGMQFLSSPIRFEPGEDVVEFNVLLSGGMPQGEVPAGHSGITGEPAQGRPVRPNALHTILLSVWVTLIFALLAVLARRKLRAGGEQRLPAAARGLVRDIASLDNSHAGGVIGEEEYRKVREGLMTRLRALIGRGQEI
jgi:hypothetical protein